MNSPHPQGKARTRHYRSMLAVLVRLRLIYLLPLLIGAGLFLALRQPATQAPPPVPQRNFVLHEAPRPLPSLSFHDGDGRKTRLAEFRGKVVLLNIWATWCGPCRREMPTLDRLQEILGGATFEVVALSIDRAGPAVVRKFFKEVGVRTLDLYIDATGKATVALGIGGLPATLLIDREGYEIGRLIGPAEWDAPDMVAFLKSRLSDQLKRDGARGSK